MDYDYLHFGYKIDNEHRLSVYDRTTATIGDHDWQFAIIGSSHCVRAPGLDFQEIASCDERTVPDSLQLDLREERATTVEYEGDALACETTISVVPIERFPADRSFDLCHGFAERAITAIDIDETGYETWHTYTEHETAVYTETTLDLTEREPPLPEDVASL